MPMKFEVYCDESHPDVFFSKKNPAKYLVIGSLWLEADVRAELKAAIHDLRDKHKIGPDFKWAKVSPNKAEFYHQLISLFFDYPDRVRFRCIARRKARLDKDSPSGLYYATVAKLA